MAAMLAAFGVYPFDRECLRECPAPVFLAYGDLTGEHEEIRARILGRLLPDIHIRRFRVHHFVAPEQICTSEHLRELRDLWKREG